MPSKPTLRDWLASRTVKLNAFLLAIWTTVLPMIVMWDESDWQELGLSKSAALIIVLVVNVVSNISNLYLRRVTTTPLAYRADVTP